MSSCLILDDGKIDAATIARKKFAFEEVVLSACSTGRRPRHVEDKIQLAGDDILGLPGALLEAGVQSILVSVPLANDKATRTFMEIYHERRSRGKTPLFALQETQKAMLGAGHFAPKDWIGFTVYGVQ